MDDGDHVGRLVVSPAAQKRANWVAIAFGIFLSAVTLGALTGFATMSEEDIKEAKRIEKIMFDQKVASGEIEADNHKFDHSDEHADQPAEHDLQEADNSKSSDVPSDETKTSRKTESDTSTLPTALLKSN